MVCKIITVCNQKGGSGKTTVTMQLGGTLSLRKNKVLIVDGDFQGSAMEWASLSPEDCPFPAQVCSLYQAGKKIHQEIKRFFDNYDYILVDCPPSAESPIAKSSLVISDLCLVPFVPSALDVLASTKIRDLIEDAKILNPNLICKILINRIEPNTKLTKTIVDLTSNFGIDILNTNLKKRTYYAESVLNGSTVHKFKSRAIEAIQEVEKLTDEIIGILRP
jgi:chromosome partitioning protein